MSATVKLPYGELVCSLWSINTLRTAPGKVSARLGPEMEWLLRVQNEGRITPQKRSNAMAIPSHRPLPFAARNDPDQ